MFDDKRLTKYECSRLIGIRMNQLADNAPIMTSVDARLKTNLLYVASKELWEQKLNCVIERPLPDAKHYKVNVQTLRIPEDVYQILSLYEDALTQQDCAE